MSTYFCILTSLGVAKMANATALGEVVEFSQMALGNGSGSLPTPDQSQTSLVNEVRRAALNSVEIDPDNPTWIVCEQVIPADVGGWTIRETGIYDIDGDLIAVGNFPETYKPVLEEGSGRTQTIRMVIQVSNAATVTLKIDPSVVLATREYVDLKDTAHAEADDPHTQYQTKVLAASEAQEQKAYFDSLQSIKMRFDVSGDENDIVLTSKDSLTPINKLNDYDEFSFIVDTTNTLSSVTIKIDGLDVVSLFGISSDTQVFETALLTIRYIDGAFYIASQINPATGNNVCDIAVIEPMMTDVLLPGEYAVIGSELNSLDHPIGVAKVMAGSNLIDQATKDTDLEKYSGKFGWVNEGDGSITITLPDVSGEFFRFDDASGRGVNSDQLIGDWKPSDYESHSHGLYMGDDLTVTRSDGFPAPSDSRGYNNENQLPINSSGGDETRPRGHAWKAKTKM